VGPPQTYNRGPLEYAAKLILDFVIGIQNIAFCRKNRIQYQWTDNKFQYSACSVPPSFRAGDYAGVLSAPWNIRDLHNVINTITHPISKFHLYILLWGVEYTALEIGHSSLY